MHKCKRPRYKVGDILEEWYKNEWTQAYLVVQVDLLWLQAQKLKNKAITKRMEWWYTLLNLETGELEELTARYVDRPSQYISQKSSEWIGYRKIG